MGMIREAPERAKKDLPSGKAGAAFKNELASGRRPNQVKLTTKRDEDDDDSYESDNDFEPYETSRREFNQNDSS